MIAESLPCEDRAGHPPLRVGILLDDVRLPRCFAEVLDSIAASRCARIELLVFRSGPVPETSGGDVPSLARGASPSRPSATVPFSLWTLRTVGPPTPRRDLGRSSRGDRLHAEARRNRAPRGQAPHQRLRASLPSSGDRCDSRQEPRRAGALRLQHPARRDSASRSVRHLVLPPRRQRLLPRRSRLIFGSWWNGTRGRA